MRAMQRATLIFVVFMFIMASCSNKQTVEQKIEVRLTKDDTVVFTQNELEWVDEDKQQMKVKGLTTALADRMSLNAEPFELTINDELIYEGKFVNPLSSVYNPSPFSISVFPNVDISNNDIYSFHLAKSENAVLDSKLNKGIVKDRKVLLDPRLSKALKELGKLR